MAFDSAKLMPVVELTRTLVAVPSESQQSNVPVMDALASHLEPHGFRMRRYPQKITHPGSGAKVNMIAERGNGPRRLVFSGHVDTVPVGDETLWTHDPYGGDGVLDGRLYGRGSVDMKGAVAAMALACAGADDVLDELTLVLAITGDEEVGHMGIKSLASEHVFCDAVGAVVGEPTGFAVYRAHKGGMTVRVTVHGISCHSSRPSLGVNAIDQAVRLISRLEDGLREWCAQRHPAFDDEPPTFTVARIRGGVADNVVPDSCEVNISARALVMDHFEGFREAILRIIRRIKDEDVAAGVPPERQFSADLELIKWAPPMVCETDSAWYRLIAEFAGQDTPRFARYGTDGGVLGQVGLPCVIWGPGDIARAHKPDEYVTVKELEEAPRRYGGLIGRVADARLPTVTTCLWKG